MTIELKVPEAGESVTEAEIVEWLKAEGDSVDEDESVVVLESEKASQEIPCPVSGILARILKQAGETVAVGEVIGHVERSREGEAGKTGDEGEEAATQEADRTDDGRQDEDLREEGRASAAGAEQRKQQQQQQKKKKKKEEQGKERDEDEQQEDNDQEDNDEEQKDEDESQKRARREMSVEEVDEDEEDEPRAREAPPSETEDTRRSPRRPSGEDGREEEVVPMTPLRRHLAERLVEAMRTAALLTTFNEINMSRVIELRQTLRDEFRSSHDVKLGFMSFFVKAVVDALNRVPELNARIEDEAIVYHNYQDIGVAVGSGRGLVVPVLRDAQRMSFAAIELAIQDFAERAEERELRPEELRGGTFTISNGGVYGSLLSTPIVNPPQSGILGVHKIEERPVARDGQVEIRPMMYVALTYDHRIVDGREAVTFLQRVKESIEEPSRMLLEV